MWIVEIFKDGEWQAASQHTLEIDAQSQKQRYLDSGITEDEVRVRQESAL